MNPDVAQAIPDMARCGILEEEKAPRLLRIARGELVSFRQEIRLLFYLGVLLTAAGAGLLVKQNYQHIVPLAVALVVGIGALWRRVRRRGRLGRVLAFTDPEPPN